MMTSVHKQSTSVSTAHQDSAHAGKRKTELQETYLQQLRDYVRDVKTWEEELAKVHWTLDSSEKYLGKALVEVGLHPDYRSSDVDDLITRIWTRVNELRRLVHTHPTNDTQPSDNAKPSDNATPADNTKPSDDTLIKEVLEEHNMKSADDLRHALQHSAYFTRTVMKWTDLRKNESEYHKGEHSEEDDEEYRRSLKFLRVSHTRVTDPQHLPLDAVYAYHMVRKCQIEQIMEEEKDEEINAKLINERFHNHLVHLTQQEVDQQNFNPDYLTKYIRRDKKKVMQSMMLAYIINTQFEPRKFLEAVILRSLEELKGKTSENDLCYDHIVYMETIKQTSDVINGGHVKEEHFVEYCKKPLLQSFKKPRMDAQGRAYCIEDQLEVSFGSGHRRFLRTLGADPSNTFIKDFEAYFPAGLPNRIVILLAQIAIQKIRHPKEGKRNVLEIPIPGVFVVVQDQAVKEDFHKNKAKKEQDPKEQEWIAQRKGIYKSKAKEKQDLEEQEWLNQIDRETRPANEEHEPEEIRKQVWQNLLPNIPKKANIKYEEYEHFKNLESRLKETLGLSRVGAEYYDKYVNWMIKWTLTKYVKSNTAKQVREHLKIRAELPYPRHPKLEPSDTLLAFHG